MQRLFMANFLGQNTFDAFKSSIFIRIYSISQVLLNCGNWYDWNSGKRQACYLLDLLGKRERKWVQYNTLPDSMCALGQSGIGASSGLFGFSNLSSAFLPRGSNSWGELKNPSNSSFYFSCAVSISSSELLVMGGSWYWDEDHGRQVWKLKISDNLTSHEWTKMKDLKTARWGHGCSLHSTKYHEKYVIVAGKDVCNNE